jgi:hypothetical protein
MRSLALLTLALFAGCSRLPGGAPVEALTVSEANLAGNPELGLSSEQAQRAAVAGLEGTRKFSLQKRGARVRLEVEHARRLPAPAPAREQAEVMVSLELLPDGEGERLLSEGLARRPMGEGTLDAEAREAAFGAALEGAVGEAALALNYQLEARKKPDAELIVDLGSTDARLRDYAVRVLADRRNPAAVPSLILRLSDDSPLIVQRAIGALVTIGDRRAVRPLIELSRKKPPQIVAQILYGLGSLGGAEAESFLYTLESGASDEEVRRAAAEAFADLRRKQSEAAARDPHTGSQ